MMVNKKEYPALFRVLREAGYRKHNAYVYMGLDTVLTESYWSEGSKEDHFVLNLNTGALTPLCIQGKGYPNPPAQERVETAPGLAVVTGGIFCGRLATWKVVLHDSDHQKLVSDLI